MDNISKIAFDNTLEGYAQGFRVGHIATFGLETCSPDEIASEVFNRFDSFDYIPAQHDGRIIGILERNHESINKPVHECFRPLDDGILVSADEALSNFLPLMAKPPFYRLVIQGTRISGIVTRSDLLKLPVRMYGFALVSNLEITMKELIIKKIPNEVDWLSLLSPGRIEKIKNRKHEYMKDKLDPDFIEFTDFYDKFNILKKYLKLSSDFEKDMEDIQEQLRNPIAHNRNFAPDLQSLVNFLEVLKKVQIWTYKLSQRINDIAYND